MMVKARQATALTTIVTVRRMSTMMAMARRMTTLTKMIVMDNDVDNNDGDDATGNDNDVDGMAQRTTTMGAAMIATAG